MCEDKKFFVCKICGNLIGMIHSSGNPIVCCGQEMTELVPNTVDASKEKHVPVITQEGNTVTVKIGSAPHPMTKEHHIAWIYLETEAGGQRKCLDVNGEPVVTFALVEGDKAKAAYAYCNLHGLWKGEA